MNLRVAIVGAGALGLYYGSLLAKHGRDTGARVAFLARSDYEILKGRGVIVHSTDGDFALPADRIHVFDSRRPQELAREFGPVDLIVIGLKTTANEAAYRRLLPPLFDDKHTVVLCLQNGLGNEAALSEFIPADRILGGTAFLCSNRIAPAEIEHTEHAMIHIAPYAAGFAAPRPELEAEAVCAMFTASGVDCRLRPNYVEMRWRKQIWNVPFNALCTIHDCATDRLLAMPGMTERIAAAMREIIGLGEQVNAALQAQNTHPVSERSLNTEHLLNCGEYNLATKADEIVEEQLAKTRAMGAYKPSMLLDFRAGRALEYDAIIGTCLQERQRHAPEFPIPEIERIARELRAVQPQ